MSITLRYSNTHKGSMVLLGNCGNIEDSLYSTSDILTLPSNSSIKCAELGWYDCNNSNEVVFETPNSSNKIVYEHLENSDGNDWKGSNVTSLVNIGQSGVYTVTFKATNNPSWFLLIVYENINLPFRHFKVYTGSVFNTWSIKASKFLTPLSGESNAKLFYGFSRGEFTDTSILSLGDLSATTNSLPLDCNLCETDISNYISNGQSTFNLYQNYQTNTLNALGLQLDSIYTNISLVKAVNKTIVNSGECILYTTTLTNNGPSSLINTIFRDTIPTGTTFVEDSLFINGILNTKLSPYTDIMLNTIPVGDTTTISFKVLIDSSFINNTLESSTKLFYQLENDTCPIFSCDSNTVVSNVIPIPSFSNSYYKLNTSYAKTGDTVKHTIYLVNDGPLEATDATLYITLPNGLSLVENSLKINGMSSETLNFDKGFSLGTLSNSTGVLTITFSTDVTTSIGVCENSFTLQYNAKTLPDTRLIYESNLILLTIPNIILEHIKFPDDFKGFIGQKIPYTITISNDGNIPCSGRFTDTISPSLKILDNSITQDGITISSDAINADGNIDFIINEIPPNTSTNICYLVTILSIPNSNPIKSFSTFSGEYLIASNDTPLISGVVNSISNESSLMILYANLNGLRKFPSKTFAVRGDYLDYTIVGKNTGNYPAKNIFIRDSLQPQLCFVVDSVYLNGVLLEGANPLLGITIPNINPDETITITYKTQAL